jgi:hypothetical protein
LGLSVILELQPEADSALELIVLDTSPAIESKVDIGSTVTLKVVNVLP